MNEPEIPGRIIAQIAIAPHTAIYHRPAGGCRVSGSPTMIQAAAAPASAPMIRSNDHFDTRWNTAKIEASTSPKKNDQISAGL